MLWFCQAWADQHRVGAPKPGTQEVVWLPNLMIPVPNYLRFSINLLDYTQEPEEHLGLARVGKIKCITVELGSAKGWEQAEVLSRRLECVLGHLWHWTCSRAQSPAAAGFPHSLWGLELALQGRACSSALRQVPSAGSEQHVEWGDLHWGLKAHSQTSVQGSFLT